jgi:hypothetical protein
VDAAIVIVALLVAFLVSMEVTEGGEPDAPIADWPDYEVPVGAIAENQGATPDSASPAVPASTTAPATPAVAATPAVPATGAPGTATTQPPATQPELPPYRVEEILQRERRTNDALAAANAEIARLKATPPPAAAATPVPPTPAVVEPPDPQSEAIRNRLLEVFPELKRLSEIAKLADRTGDLDMATSAARQMVAAQESINEAYTTEQLTSLHGLVAAEYGKKVEELPEMVRESANFQFGKWVHADPTRVARYNAFDKNLVGEFWPIFKSAVYDPVRRSTSAATLTAAAGRTGLPLGGTTAAPMAHAAPKPPAASDDEDAIHDRGWDMVRAAAGG